MTGRNGINASERSWRRLVKLLHLGSWAVLLGICAAMAHAASPVYVGASYGLYKSLDAGATWANVNIPLNSPLLSGPLRVASLGMDPHDASKLYLIGHVTADAFFASLDAGQTWSATPFVGMVPGKLAVDFAGKVVYVIVCDSYQLPPVPVIGVSTRARHRRNVDSAQAPQYLRFFREPVYIRCSGG